ncbi:nuclear pore complex protein Nup205-like [Acanthaster planci]|uniref:Nuclear pore complex protein Nup205-like n=1 Tax=Acanthaster planci TaxID=133434 RepID=A0A8B8A251_ACAPL|nr:nuclear pore complex protein Nup205-like [Acanthaster planci]
MADSKAVNLGSNLWSPFKELLRTVHAALSQKLPDAFYELDAAIRKHKPDFISLLQNPAKNAQHRLQIRKADVTGLVIEGQPGTKTFPRQFIDEALIISDLFDLNEYFAVELLLSGEQQQPHFPGLTRGLVAVLLYYDGRRSVINALQLLIQSRKGRTWTLELEDEVSDLTTRFTDELIRDGLMRKILTLLLETDVEKQMDKLGQARALGDARHRHEVMEMLKEIRSSLAECLFAWACQSAPSRQDAGLLIDHLRRHAGLEADGRLDGVTLSLLMACLYCLDVGGLTETRPEDRDELTKQLPVLNDAEFLPDLHQMIVKDEAEWACPGIAAVLRFAWALMLRNVAQQPEVDAMQDFIEEDEMIVDDAMKDNVFRFLTDAVVASGNFHQLEFCARRLHGLVTDFIVQMPLKVKDMRNRGDDVGRTIMAYELEGVEPPSTLPRHFQDFMKLLGALYGNDPLGLELPLEYWCTPDHSSSPSASATYVSHPHQRQSPRQASLFKFIRMAGDLLPPSLYVAYIDMLSGLANGEESARHCFNLLKMNGMGSGGSSSTVSWDHFFLSINRYYTSLRQEATSSPRPEVAQAHAMHRYSVVKGITPQEMEGLLAVLRLTQVIAKWDETARLALCENQSWLPIVLLLGLISCSVPPKLKGQCLRTLATLAHSPEVGAKLWQSLEVSQVIPTVVQPGSPASGIPVELDEIESSNEEYPLTCGFLDLMSSLLELPVPAALGAGYRPPGFDPYLEFLRDTVFLKYRWRAYRDPGEKWEVAAGVTEIFCKLLQDYEPQPQDFVDHPVEIQGGGLGMANKPPGYHLMEHMLNDSAMLRLILQIIDEVTQILDQYRLTIPGKSQMVKCALMCLQMVQLTLEKQNAFVDLVRMQGSGVMVSTMDELLMAINPRSETADHLVNIAKFVTHGDTHPKHALASTRILHSTVRASNKQPDIVGLFTAKEEVRRNLLRGFVDCLETEDPEDLAAAASEDLPTDEDTLAEEDTAKVRSATRLYILRLLLYSLEQPSPNLAHFLLGYEYRKPASKTNLQEPGVLGSPRTCLHSILNVLSLDRDVNARLGPLAIHAMPRLAELAYEMIYRLCANRETSDPTMRYLRASQDFFYSQLRHLPFSGSAAGNVEEGLRLNQQSWLLKAIATEIRLTAVNRQRSHLQRLLRLLLEDSPSLLFGDEETDEQGVADVSLIAEHGALGMSTMYQPGQSRVTGTQVRRKILTLLDSIDLVQDLPPSLRLEYSDPVTMEKTIGAFELPAERGGVASLCDVRQLHRFLTANLNSLQGASAIGQRPLVMQEIEAVLLNVTKRNNFRQGLAAKRHNFDAWRHVAEVVLTSCPAEVLPLATKQKVVVELLQELLSKVCEEEVTPDLASPVGGVLLTLMTSLRECILTDETESIPQLLSAQYVRAMDGSSVMGGGAGPAVESRAPLRGLGVEVVSLTAILKELLKFIVISGGSQQRTRANLYGTLLNYLQIPRKPREIPTMQDGSTVLNSALLDEYETITAANLATMQEYGEGVMELVCRDASDGLGVGRMLALSVIDTIVGIDKRGDWLSFLSAKGYLRHLVENLAQEDQSLLESLQPTPEPLRALFIYESQMSLLEKIALNPVGAQALLRAGLMARLASCRFLDLRPEHSTQSRLRMGSTGLEPVEVETFIPSVMQRYRQLLFPVLRLCLAILTSLGSQHKEAASQVLHFVVSHSDIFTAILREQHAELQLEPLQELALATSVICTVAADITFYDLPSDPSMPNHVPIQTHLSRIHRQIMALVPRFCALDRWLRDLKRLETAPQGGDAPSHTPHHKDSIRQVLLEISRNVIGYCKNIVVLSGSTAKDSQILFTPNLQEATARDYQAIEGVHLSSLDLTRPPTLGIIVRHLRQAASEFMSTMDSHQQHLHKLKNIADLSTEELKELIQTASGPTSEKLSSSHRLQLATRKLADTVRQKADELAVLYYMIECSLFLVWRHLEFYLLYCQTSKDSLLHKLSLPRQQPRNLADPNRFLLDGAGDDPSHTPISPVLLGITNDDIKQLRVDATSCLSEMLLKRTREIEAQFIRGQSRYTFISVLVRRIRRLLMLGAP